MSFFEKLKAQRHAKEVGGRVVKDEYGYRVELQSPNLSRADMIQLTPEQVLQMYEGKDLGAMEPRMRDIALKAIARAKQDIEKARDERWLKK
jgi:hypothetical protein